MLRAKQEGDVCGTGKGPWKTHVRKTGTSRNMHTPARSICCTGNFNSVIISEINMIVHLCQAPGVYVGRALLARSLRGLVAFVSASNLAGFWLRFETVGHGCVSIFGASVLSDRKN